MKRWHYVAGGILVAGIGLGGLAGGGSGSTVFSAVGQRMAVVRQLPSTSVATIRGESISLKEIELRRNTMLVNKQAARDHSSVTKQEALNALLGTKVEIAEARARGLYPSTADIDRQYKADQEQWAKAPAVDRNRREAAITEYVKGAGLTRAQYDQIDRKLTGIEMAIVRLRQDYKAGLAEADEAAKEQAYRAFTDRLVKAAQLKIMDEALLVD